MTIDNLLYITLIVYSMVMTFGYLFKFKYLYMIGGLLWFIPIIEIDNVFIILISVVMMVSHFVLGFMDDHEREF